MKRKQKSLCLVMILLAEIFFRISVAKAAEGTYTDTRFQSVYSTENLDVIIEAYELFDGWYWSTQLNVTQNYHGQEGKKAGPKPPRIVLIHSFIPGAGSDAVGIGI
ncbi:MAG: hypothetical protein IJJ60_05925 [Clostridia bacterium]|nr:hypothetical protein [Clostridia bacterium]